ncbi:MAG: SnoaL-like domain [Alphaproteobacteria bacterium]|nr:SnoaL-like domain [Alphaproteobacteria bacterium]
MKRMTTLAAAALLLLAALLAGGIAQAQRSDADNVKAAVEGFFAALSARDIGKMTAVWVQEPAVILINPRDKAPSVGWDAAKKNWETTFEFWAELKAAPKEASRIHVNQATAISSTVAAVEGKNKAGQTVSFTALVTQMFEKRGERWLMVASHASRMPE